MSFRVNLWLTRFLFQVYDQLDNAKPFATNEHEFSRIKALEISLGLIRVPSCKFAAESFPSTGNAIIRH